MHQQARAHLRGESSTSPRLDWVGDILASAASSGRCVRFLGQHRAAEVVPLASIHRRCLGHAASLRLEGVEPGDRVAIIEPEPSRFLEGFFGVLYAGAIPVPLSSPRLMAEVPRYLRRIAEVFDSAQPTFLIVGPRLANHAARLLRFIPGMRGVATLETLPLAPALEAPIQRLPDDPAVIQYTSGTTKQPRGATLSSRAVLHNIHAVSTTLGLDQSDSIVSWLPLFHDMGLFGSVLTALYAGAELTLTSPESFIRDPVAWLEAMDEYEATIAVAPNFAYQLCTRKFLKRPRNVSLRRLRVLMCGAEPVDAGMIDDFERVFREYDLTSGAFMPVYGMAENTLALTFPRVGAGVQVARVDRNALETEGIVRSDKGGRPLVSVGTPLPGMEVQVRREQRVAEEGVVGCIYARSQSLMGAYFRRPDDTQRVLGEDGWLRTGDLGFVHNGELYIAGRENDLIIRCGRNFYPYDIERAAAKVAGVRQGGVVAIGVPNQSRGTEDLVVIAEAEENRQPSESAIRARIEAQVGVVPDTLAVVPPRSIPKTSSGKVQRSLCRSWFVSGEVQARDTDEVRAL